MMQSAIARAQQRMAPTARCHPFLLLLLLLLMVMMMMSCGSASATANA